MRDVQELGETMKEKIEKEYPMLLKFAMVVEIFAAAGLAMSDRKAWDVAQAELDVVRLPGMGKNRYSRDSVVAYLERVQGMMGRGKFTSKSSKATV